MNDAGGDRWTLPFAIVMLLLFALFLSLYALAKKETVRLSVEIESLKQEHARPRPANAPPLSAEKNGNDATPSPLNAELGAAILSEAKAFLSKDGAGTSATARPDVEVLDLAGGDFLVRIAAPDLYAPGVSKISPSVRAFVDRIGELIVRSGRRLRIEGHADFDDSETIQRHTSEYSNTWELSAGRSASLAQYWMRKLDLDPMKIEVTGFGKYRPLEKRSGRPPQANRRIEILILRSEG